MKERLKLRLNLQFFSDDQQQDDDKNQDTPDQDKPDGDGNEQQQDKGFTQEQLDAILDKRLKRERKKWQEELDEQKKRDKMDAEQLAKHEKEQAEKKAEQALKNANNRIKETEAKAMALELGVDPKKIKYFLKMADIADIEVDDEGNVDTTAMKGALTTVLNDMPEFKGGQQRKGGADFNGGTPTITLEQINNMSVDEINANWEHVQKVLAQS